MQTSSKILQIYKTLLSHFGSQNWWPGETKDEIIIGAILTQSVNWQNVETAIQNLKRENLCSLEAIHYTKIETNTDCSKERIRSIIDKSLSIKRLDPDETATLLNVLGFTALESKDGKGVTGGILKRDGSGAKNRFGERWFNSQCRWLVSA